MANLLHAATKSIVCLCQADGGPSVTESWAASGSLCLASADAVRPPTRSKFKFLASKINTVTNDDTVKASWQLVIHNSSIDTCKN